MGLTGLLILLLLGGVPLLMRGPAHQTLRGHQAAALPVPSQRQVLRVATFNMAHLRGHGWHQILTPRARRRALLAALDATLVDQAIDLIALQEIDGPSWWSGGMDMPTLIAQPRGWDRGLRGSHVRGLGLDYGTALLARFRLTHGRAVTWPGRFGSPPKGAVIARLTRNAAPLQVVSCHLDPLWSSRRRAQVRLLAERLQKRALPVLVMGDFNCGWEDPESAVRLLARLLDLRPWPAPTSGPATFADGRRLDWILVSRPMRLRRVAVLDTVASDHRLVVAELYWPVPSTPRSEAVDG